MKHYTIPVFIPELACPFQCAFCNQQKISGRLHVPVKAEIVRTFDEYLRSFKIKKRHVEVGFFGGTFTGIPLTEQEKYLQLVQPYLENGNIQGIRISTRPDYINDEVLELLKKYHVSTIELGAQSLDDEVLKAAHRGHTAMQVEKSSRKIRSAGFELGLQMMIGLPEDKIEKSLATARKIIELGASNTRIYPVLVIKGTAMHRWYMHHQYKPLTLYEAVYQSKQLLLLFEKSGVKVIRLGLHPSEGLLHGSELVAGPFHPSFRELVLTEIWGDIFKPLMKSKQNVQLNLHVPLSEINYAIGHRAKNKRLLLKHFVQVRFVANATLQVRQYVAENLVLTSPPYFPV